MQIEHWKLGSYANNLIGLGRIMEFPEGTHRDAGAQPLPCTEPQPVVTKVTPKVSPCP